jgi:hypothetical protein
MTLDEMKRVVNYNDKYPNHGLSSIQKRACRKLKSKDYIRNCRKHVANNGNRIHHLKRIDDYVFDKFRKARDNYMPVNSIDIKRWAIECFKANSQNSNFEFRASDGWVHSFKKRHRIVSRKVVKIVCYREVKNFERVQESINDFRDLYEERKSDYLDRYT